LVGPGVSLPTMTGRLPSFEVKAPTRFTILAVFSSSLYGLLLIVPVFAGILAITAFHFGLVTFLIPFGAILLATFFLPLGFGNLYIVLLVRSFAPKDRSDRDCTVVQLTKIPRLRSGPRALFEDADDVGMLFYEEAALEFHGDSIRFTAPYTSIRELRQQITGSRALFAYGRATVFRVEDLPQLGTLCLAERSSWVLPGSHRNAERMYSRLRQKIEGQHSGGSSEKKPGERTDGR